MRSIVGAMMFAISLTASAQTAKVTGTFSNLFYHSEAGDVLGMEVVISFASSQGYFAVLQCAEGAPSKPAVVSVSVRGTEVEFAPHSEPSSHCPSAVFRGKVSSTGLTGKFEGTEYPDRPLKRGQSYWQ